MNSKGEWKTHDLLENSLNNGIKLGRITLPERDYVLKKYACSSIPSELKVKTLHKGISLIVE